MSLHRLLHCRTTVLNLPLHHHRHHLNRLFSSSAIAAAVESPLFPYTPTAATTDAGEPPQDTYAPLRRSNDPLHSLLLRGLPSSSTAAAATAFSSITSAALAGPQVELHNRVESLTTVGDLHNAAAVVRTAFSSETPPSVFTCNAVLSALLGAKRYDEVASLFEFFFEQYDVVPNIESYDVLIGAHCNCSRVDKALELYQKVRSDAAFTPSCVTFQHLTKALVDSGRINDAVEKLKEMLNLGLGADSLAYQNVIKGFLNLGDLNRAKEFFEELKSRCSVYDGVVNATFMDWYFSHEMINEAVESYHSLFAGRNMVAPATGNAFLEVFLKHGKRDEAGQLFEWMLDNHMSPTYEAVNSETFNIMVNECFKEKRYEEAVNMFRKVGTKVGSRPFNMDVAGYNNMIAKFVEHGMVSEAENVFKELQMKSPSRDVMAHKMLIDAYLKEKRVDEALGMINQMVDGNLPVIKEHVNEWLTVLVESNKAAECTQILIKLGGRDLKPDSSTYEVVIRALIEENSLEGVVDLVGQMVRSSIGMHESLLEAFEKEGVKEKIEKVLEERKQQARIRKYEEPKQTASPSYGQTAFSSSGGFGTAGAGQSAFSAQTGYSEPHQQTGTGQFPTSGGSGMFSPSSAGTAPASTGYPAQTGDGGVSGKSETIERVLERRRQARLQSTEAARQGRSAGFQPPVSSAGMAANTGYPASPVHTGYSSQTGYTGAAGQNGYSSVGQTGFSAAAGQTGYSSVAQTGFSAPGGQTGYSAQSGQTEYSPVGQAGYSAQAGQMGYSPVPQTGYSTPSMQTGYSSSVAQTGYSPVGQTGHPGGYSVSAVQTAFSPLGQTGYSAQTGFSPQSVQMGYTPVSQTGYAAPPGHTGYSAQSGPMGHSPVAQTGYSAPSWQTRPSEPTPQTVYSAPLGQTGYSPVAHTGYSAQSGQMGYSPVPQAGYPPVTQSQYSVPSEQMGHSPVGQSGFSLQSGQSGYPVPSTQTGYSAQSGQMAYSPVGQTGYSAQSAGQTGFSPVPQTGYSAPPGQMGYPPVAQTGYPVQSGQMEQAVQTGYHGQDPINQGGFPGPAQQGYGFPR